MIFSNRIRQLEKIVYDGFKVFLDSIAVFLGYPEVPGMPIFPLNSKARDQLMDKDLLPKHITEIPPTQVQRPETLTEALFYNSQIKHHILREIPVGGNVADNIRQLGDILASEVLQLRTFECIEDDIKNFHICYKNNLA